MQPINYSTDVQTPFATALQGYQAGAAIRNDQQQQQQAAAAQQQQQALQRAYAETAASPTADNYSRLMLLDPKASEGITRSWTVKNTQQQQAHTSDLLQWGAAIKSGKPDIAAAQLKARADLIDRQNGGQPTQESQILRTYAQAAVDHPAFTLGQIQAMLAANPNGKDAAETLAKFGGEQRAQELQPAAVAEGAAKAITAQAAAGVAPAVQAATRDKAVADASTAQVTAQFANQNAVLELQKKGWDIKAIEADMGFKREANRIAAMNAATSREGNALKREEQSLKVQEARNALDGKIREKVASAENGASSIDNMLNTVQRILKNPSLNSVVGSLEGKAYYPNTVAGSMNPFGDGDERADAIALIETLGSQAFLAQIPSIKGMGALSNAEGDKLQSALQNLGRAQSEKQFRVS